MDSASPADSSFTSKDESGEIEIAAVNHNSGTVEKNKNGHDHMIKDDGQSKKDNKEKIIIDTKVVTKWNQIIIVLAFTALLSLIGTSIVIDGKIMTRELLKQFVIINIMSFFFAMNGIILNEICLEISKPCNLIALASMILSFTVLSSALLHPHFRWIPWSFFAVTCVSLTCYAVCEVCIYMKRIKVVRRFEPPLVS